VYDGQPSMPLGNRSTNLGLELQQQYHQQVFPALVGAMDDFQNPRVQVRVFACHGVFKYSC